MNQKEKLDLLREALGEFCDGLTDLLDKAKGVLHDVTYGPGPAGPVVIDLGEAFDRRVGGLAGKKRRRASHRPTKR